MSRWIVFKAGRQFGPFSDSQLKALASEGKLLPEDVVGLANSVSRIRAGRIRGLFTSINSRQSDSHALASESPQPRQPRPVNQENGGSENQSTPPKLLSKNHPRPSRIARSHGSSLRDRTPHWAAIGVSSTIALLVVAGFVFSLNKGASSNTPDPAQPSSDHVPTVSATASREPSKASNDSPQGAAAEKAASQPTERQFLFDLSDPTCTMPSQCQNAFIHNEQGEIFYWAPSQLGAWATVAYKIDVPFKIKDVAMDGIGVDAWNKNADKSFDDDAEAFLEVSTDGDEWFTVASTTPTGGVTQSSDWSQKLLGHTSFFLRARLLGKVRRNPSVHHVQFMRSNPSSGKLPWIMVWSTNVPHEGRAERISQANASAAERARRVAAKQYRLSDGSSVSRQEIDEWNKKVLGNTARFLLRLDEHEVINHTMGLGQLRKLVSLTQVGDDQSLQKQMKVLLAHKEVLNAIERIIISRSPIASAVVPCSDGRALEWREVWAEALAKLIP